MEKYTSDGLQIELITEQRYEDMANFIKDHYATEEPLGKSVNYKWDCQLYDMIIANLKQNLSVALVKAETGEILAGQIATIENKFDRLEPIALKSKALEKVFKLDSDLHKLCNLFERYEVEKIIHLRQLATHKDHSRRGFATKLNKALLEALKSLEMGPIAVQVECSHNGSKGVFEKLGFDSLAEIKFAKYKIGGQLVFTNTGEHKSEILYGKMI